MDANGLQTMESGTMGSHDRKYKSHYIGCSRRNVVLAIRASHACNRMDALEMQKERVDGCMQWEALACHAPVKCASLAFERLIIASCLGLSRSMHSHVDQAREVPLAKQKHQRVLLFIGW